MGIEVSAALNIIVWVIVATAAVMIFFGYLVNQKNRKNGQNGQNPHSTASPKPPTATAPRHSQQKSAVNQFNIQRNLPTQSERNQGITCTYTIINESNGEKWQGRFEKGGFFSPRIAAVKNVQTGVEYSANISGMSIGDVYESRNGSVPQRLGRFHQLHNYKASPHFNGIVHSREKVEGDYFVTYSENKRQIAIAKYSGGNDKFRPNRNFRIFSENVHEYALLIHAIRGDNVAGGGLNGNFQPFSTAGKFMIKLKLGHEYEGHRLDWMPGGGK